MKRSSLSLRKHPPQKICEQHTRTSNERKRTGNHPPTYPPTNSAHPPTTSLTHPLPTPFTHPPHSPLPTHPPTFTLLYPPNPPTHLQPPLPPLPNPPTRPRTCQCKPSRLPTNGNVPACSTMHKVCLAGYTGGES